MKTHTDTAKATMLTGKRCHCCTDTTKVLARRRAKRRERQAVQRLIRLTY